MLITAVRIMVINKASAGEDVGIKRNNYTVWWGCKFV
jgi:hypothetical protein